MGETKANAVGQDEVTILARVLCNNDGELPADIARYLLSLDFCERDESRAHELAVRNQEGSLSSAETEELLAYAKAGGLLAILKAKARFVLGVKPKKRSAS